MRRELLDYGHLRGFTPVMYNPAMSDEETDLLRALALMCEQYLSDEDRIDHTCMSAGEEAVEQLVKYGLLAPCPRGGRWTEAGRVLLD